MFVTHCSHISTPYSERQTQLVFQLCVHFGWSSLLMKLLSAMMKLSWLEAVFWCKEYLRRCCCNSRFTFSRCCCRYVLLSSCFILFNLTSPMVSNNFCTLLPASETCIGIFAQWTIMVLPEFWDCIQGRQSS